jgi:hypothetical protein
MVTEGKLHPTSASSKQIPRGGPLPRFYPLGPRSDLIVNLPCQLGFGILLVASFILLTLHCLIDHTYILTSFPSHTSVQIATGPSKIQDRTNHTPNMGSNGNGEQKGEAVNTDIITLTRFLTEEQGKHKEATGDFTYVRTHFRLRLNELTRHGLDYFAMPSNSRSRALPTTSGERP